MIFWIFKTFAHEIASHKNRREDNFDQSQKLDHQKKKSVWLLGACVTNTVTKKAAILINNVFDM